MTHFFFLMLLRVAWARLGLRGRAEPWVYWTAVVGTCANWVMPVAGVGAPLLCTALVLAGLQQARAA